MGKIVNNHFTAVLDSKRPALSKTFQDFGFFFDVNQTVTMASNTIQYNILYLTKVT